MTPLHLNDSAAAEPSKGLMSLWQNKGIDDQKVALRSLDHMGIKMGEKSANSNKIFKTYASDSLALALVSS